MAKGVKFMEILKASIIRDGDITKLVFPVGDKNVEIVLTSDNPIDIKYAFNSLIIELKEYEFNFELEDDDEDLYTSVCQEYIKQLNSELDTIRIELVEQGLVEIASVEE